MKINQIYQELTYIVFGYCVWIYKQTVNNFFCLLFHGCYLATSRNPLKCACIQIFEDIIIGCISQMTDWKPSYKPHNCIESQYILVSAVIIFHTQYDWIWTALHLKIKYPGFFVVTLIGSDLPFAGSTEKFGSVSCVCSSPTSPGARGSPDTPSSTNKCDVHRK